MTASTPRAAAIAAAAQQLAQRIDAFSLETNTAIPALPAEFIREQTDAIILADPFLVATACRMEERGTRAQFDSGIVRQARLALNVR